jgi:hypothetical protein
MGRSWASVVMMTADTRHSASCHSARLLLGPAASGRSAPVGFRDQQQQRQGCCLSLKGKPGSRCLVPTEREAMWRAADRQGRMGFKASSDRPKSRSASCR